MEHPPQASMIASRLINGLYVEAMVLADEARSYFDREGRSDRAELEPILRVAFSCEALKVTTRLMQVVSWLLIRRAIEGGEVDRHNSLEGERRLGEATASDDEVVARLPEAARQIIVSSGDLYMRARRLDMDLNIGKVPASPVLSLLEKLQKSI